jgi:hypothetical protein
VKEEAISPSRKCSASGGGGFVFCEPALLPLLTRKRLSILWLKNQPATLKVKEEEEPRKQALLHASQ